MFGNTFQRLPAQVQPVKTGIALFQYRQYADRLFIMLEPAIICHTARQRLLTGMAKRRVAQIMRQRHSLSQIIIQPQRPRH